MYPPPHMPNVCTGATLEADAPQRQCVPSVFLRCSQCVTKVFLMCVQAQPWKRMLPNAKKAIKGDDGSDIYFMDGLVVAQVSFGHVLGVSFGHVLGLFWPCIRSLLAMY